MKVRWIPGSFRLRITPSELEMLGAGDEVVQELGPIGGWKVRLRTSKAASLSLERETIVVTIGVPDLDRLLDPYAEGVYFHSSHLPPIRYFIEKDFPCVHERPPESDEVESETFQAPSGFKDRHRSG
ncbi:MAG: hypothetical protein P4L46_26210 [Fimbriimonas sp.]|nr:hypothetical protein [Fimbriimonas sp.]